MRLLLLNDHPFVLEGLSHVLRFYGQIESIEVCSEIHEAYEKMDDFQYDLIMTDVMVGDVCGFEFIQECKKSSVRTKFIIFSSSVCYEHFQKAKQLGVEGYILKDVLPEELTNAIRLIYKGRKYYDPDIFEILQQEQLLENQLQQDQHIDQLTPKEREVLMELGKGKSNRDISQHLFISEYTVKKHVSQILSKLELGDRTQAALFANAKGLVSFTV